MKIKQEKNKINQIKKEEMEEINKRELMKHGRGVSEVLQKKTKLLHLCLLLSVNKTLLQYACVCVLCLIVSVPPVWRHSYSTCVMGMKLFSNTWRRKHCYQLISRFKADSSAHLDKRSKQYYKVCWNSHLELWPKAFDRRFRNQHGQLGALFTLQWYLDSPRAFLWRSCRRWWLKLNCQPDSGDRSIHSEIRWDIMGEWKWVRLLIMGEWKWVERHVSGE